MKDIQEVIEPRGKIYGDYKNGVEARQCIMAILDNLHRDNRGEGLSHIHYGMILDIVNKLTRLAVSPGHKDSVVDVIGYSTRYLEVIENAEKG